MYMWESLEIQMSINNIVLSCRLGLGVCAYMKERRTACMIDCVCVCGGGGGSNEQHACVWVFKERCSVCRRKEQYVCVCVCARTMYETDCAVFTHICILIAICLHVLSMSVYDLDPNFACGRAMSLWTCWTWRRTRQWSASAPATQRFDSSPLMLRFLIISHAVTE